MELHPQGVEGTWKAGIVLDWHTVASQIIGQNEFGHPIFANTRSELGELLYQFKYRNDKAALQKIVSTVVEYLGDKAKGKFDLIIPIPPSDPARTITNQIAEGLATGLGVGFSASALVKCKNTSELKSVSDPEERKRILEGAFRADKQQIESKAVLLVDDLYRSGATLEAATEVLAAQGNAKVVYVLAITRTRVHR
ncbi:MAG: ComF family protein [Candidatus Electronema sp. V4]|uniref:ComF family protein n=1 Tax=Candidatus Electronema sp. V4 TaxID=3454756 RepID=UPI0040559053